MSKESVYTSNRKEAYQLAVLLNVLEGVDDVKVRKNEDYNFDITFTIVKNGAEIKKEIAEVVKEFGLAGINFYNSEIARYFE